MHSNFHFICMLLWQYRLDFVYPTISPILHFISLATRVDIEIAATLRGWVTAIGSCPIWSKNWGICVVLPEPVSPITINVLYFFKYFNNLKISIKNSMIPFVLHTKLWLCYILFSYSKYRQLLSLWLNICITIYNIAWAILYVSLLR